MSLERSPLFDLLTQLSNQQLLRNIDVKLSQWLAMQLTHANNTQLLLSAIVSSELGDGHVCVALDDVPSIIERWPVALQQSAHSLFMADHCDVIELSATQLLDQQIMGDGSDITPLVIDNNRLYLYRYWQYECKVADKLLSSNAQPIALLESEYLQKQLSKYFSSDENPDWQRVAAAITTRHQISIISGGPGTGKTTTVTKLLAIYIESQIAINRKPIIALAAPTGKAAARLSESIAQAKDGLQLSEQVLALIPEQGKTLHRLLGSRAKSNQFIHHADNPLALDLLIIDEASMIDLPMMASIVDALSNQTRVVLIGDKDQLASVEAGSVLGDICDVPQISCYSQAQSDYLAICCGFNAITISQYPFADRLAFLQKSYRFSHDSGIGSLAKACNTGDVKALGNIFKSGFKDIEALLPSQDEQQVLKQVFAGYQDYLALIQTHFSADSNSALDPKELITCFNQYQVLCALRVGVLGVEQINQKIEQYFEKLEIKALDNRWYIGRPIMITRNDNQMQLFNGDIGVTCLDTETGQMKVWFEQGGELRGVLPSRLPQHESVFAMTVHKSQGSEFAHVMLVLNQSAKVVNKELIYTAITRAKKRFSFLGFIHLLEQSIERVTKRSSGLADKIWIKNQ